jgi:ABC-type Na+ efflux pump permease subunit
MQAGVIHLPCSPWLLMVAAVISTILHSISSDYYRNAFIRQGKADSADADEFTLFSRELARLRTGKGHTFDKMLIAVYLKYLGIQGSKSKQSPASTPKPPRTVTPLQTILWNLIGPSTHITFVIAAALLMRPMLFFIFCIGAANVWMVGLFIIQEIKPKKVQNQ